MRLLFDTNILIAADPTAIPGAEGSTPVVVALLALCQIGQHPVYHHPDSLVDIGRDRNVNRRDLRSLLIGKYPALPCPPPVTQDLRNAIGTVKDNQNDEVDAALIAAIDADAVDYLITLDQGILRRARRVNLRDRVLTPDEAVGALRAQIPSKSIPPPAVETVLAHTLSLRDPIWETFRVDYPRFDDWMAKCRREHRTAFVILGAAGEYAGVAIVRAWADPTDGLPCASHKLCSFKVSPDSIGRGFGELLLKAVMRHAASRRAAGLFLTAFEKQKLLLPLLDEFGFELQPNRTSLGELILLKRFAPPAGMDPTSVSRLEYHMRFGPPAMLLDGTQPIVVPIQPRYHARLFPDAEDQTHLFPGNFISGNTIRKAYLCHSPLRDVGPGTPILFYRSRDRQGVQCLGVAEKAVRTSDPAVISRVVGPRTVYSVQEIEKMCSKTVLAILFRHAAILPRPWSLRQLIEAGVLRQHPQSIVRVPSGGVSWIGQAMRAVS